MESLTGRWVAQLVVLVAAGSLVAGVVRAQPALAAPAEPGDATALAALPAAPGQGPVVPIYRRAVVTPQQAVAASTEPTLRVSSTQSGQFTFQVAPAVSGSAAPSWRSWPVSGTSFAVPPGAGLTHGRSYQWRVTAPDGSVLGPYPLIVDLQVDRSQSTDRSAAVGVSLATGFARYTWTGHKLRSASGDVALALDYDPANSGSPELPDRGWRLVAASATGYQYLRVNAGGSVDVVSKDNGAVTYTDGGGGFFQPVEPVAGNRVATGSYGVLVRNPDGSFTMTDSTRATVTFSAPNAQGQSFVTSESISGREQIRRTYDGATGRLTAVTDPISNRSVTLHYGGDDCPDYDGFTPAPPDLLCRVQYWDDTTTTFAYVASPAGPQLGRVVDFAQAASPLVTDFGYDGSGRLAAVRSPLTAQALASPASVEVTSTDPAAADMLTQVSYDPQGRVARVTAPAPRTGAQRMWVDYTYSSDNRTTMTTRDGRTSSVSYDPGTLATVRSANPDGGVTSTQYDDRGNPVRTVDAAGGVTTNQYDSSGMITARNTPGGGQTRFEYDRTYATKDPSDAGKAMSGLDVTYWANPTWSGAPASDELGPTPAPGRPIPGSFDVSWAGSPVPGAAGWSARMAGVLTLPAAAPAQARRPVLAARGPVARTPNRSGAGQRKPAAKRKAAAQRRAAAKRQAAAQRKAAARRPARTSAAPPPNDRYVFAVNGPNSPALWIDGVKCLPRDCSGPGVRLPGGDHRIRVDLAVRPGQAGAVQLRYSRNGGPMTTVPMSDLRPDYRLTTAERTLDTLAAGSSTMVSAHTSFTQPQLGLVGSTWNNAGFTATTDYETDPVVGTRPMGTGTSSHVPRVTGSTLPRGNATGITYWGADELADSGCPDGAAVDQGGLPRDAISPNPGDGTPTGLTTATWYTTDGGIAATRTGSGALVCRTYTDTGEPRTIDVVVAGDVRQTMTYEHADGGDPLRTRTTSTIAGEGSPEVRTATTRMDLLGRTISTTDGWGTRVDTTYTLAGQVATTTTTAPGGYQIQQTNAYDDGLLVATRISDSGSGGDPVLSARASYDKAQRLVSVAYGNGTAGRLGYDPTGVPSSTTWTDADGADWRAARVMASSGRVLATTLSGGGSTSTTRYTYDKALRLASARLATDQDVSASSWDYRYDRNSNRTRQVVDGRQITYDYDSADRLVFVAGDRALSGDVGYDPLGNITQVGDLRLAYDDTGQFRTATNRDTGAALAYQRDASGTVVSRTATTQAGTVTTRYSSSGLLLDGANRPVLHSVQLPGGVTVQRDLAADGVAAQTWLFPALSGDTMMATDGAGRPTTGAPMLYDPFGSPLRPDAPRSQSPQAPLLGWQARSGFTTDDLGTTLTLMGERLYLPALGRFAQIDPQRGGSANDYDYASQDPVNGRDATGRAAWWQWLATIVVSVALTVVTYGAMTAAAGAIATAGLSTAATVIDTVAAGSLIGAAGAGAVYTATTPIMGGELSLAGFAAAAAMGGITSLYSGYASMWFVGQSIKAGSYSAAVEAGSVGWGAVAKQGTNAAKFLYRVSVSEAAQSARPLITSTEGRMLAKIAIADTMCMEAKADLIYGSGVGLNAALANPRDPSRGHGTIGAALKMTTLYLSTLPRGCL